MPGTCRYIRNEFKSQAISETEIFSSGSTKPEVSR